MHGLIFNTSIWLLAGSTRYLSFFFLLFFQLRKKEINWLSFILTFVNQSINYHWFNSWLIEKYGANHSFINNLQSDSFIIIHHQHTTQPPQFHHSTSTINTQSINSVIHPFTITQSPAHKQQVIQSQHISQLFQHVSYSLSRPSFTLLSQFTI